MDVITRYRVTDLVLHSAEDLTALAAAGGSLRLTLCALDPREIQPAEPGATADGGARFVSGTSSSPVPRRC